MIRRQYQNIILVALLFFSNPLFGQNPISQLHINELDSIISSNRRAIEKNNFELAFKNIAEAEAYYDENGLQNPRYFGKIIFNKGRTYDFNGDILKAKEFHIKGFL